ncbi:hypothetical protein [Natrarchaeobius oligotrophus]|uniref:Uncharacterized protein n=1 Tax=Natrarchaeobius chitinivorans TaxID=1679083 RepID=A0A3N6MFB3_NATCH|nr:hypothetical protein [Natrarchaeobius chitinivorans]RQH02639.1 hypothetical protein EA472_04910 [Natrarchaeobius chitinivorans]
MLRPIFAICIVILLLLGFSFPFLEPGSESYVVAVLTVIPVGLVLIATVVLLALNWESHWE